MYIYLAGPCDLDHRSMMMAAKHMVNHAFGDNDTIYCPWELKIDNAWDYTQEEWARKVFDNDIEAIRAADLIIFISFGRESSAGANWEQGYAYALGKKIFVLQVTNDPTSLMTFCGCRNFYNVEENDRVSLSNAIRFIAQNWSKPCMTGACATTLT